MPIRLGPRPFFADQGSGAGGGGLSQQEV